MTNTRALPAVDQVLRAPCLAPTIAQWGRLRVKAALTAELQAQRDALRAQPDARAPDIEGIADLLEARLHAGGAHPLRAALNLTGTLVHTNLGRAQLPACALEAMREAAGAVTVELDLRTGTRGHRDAEVAALLCALTGAEAATVVNNNAAALLLALNTLAEARAVPVARGELIEIGGSFRLPEIMARSGAQLREIGTTNRTHARDYEAALAAGAAMVLRVHPSNYEISGFTHQESDATLAAIAHAAGVPYVVDLGAGALIDLARYGMPTEPMPHTVLAAGADLVLFSGDKLLGGPQAGLIVGRADLVRRLDANPLKRALRQDKFMLAALAEVLKLYGDPERLPRELPLLRHLQREIGAMEAIARALCDALAHRFAPAFSMRWQASEAQLGSGSQPGTRIPSVALVLEPAAGSRTSGGAAAALAALTAALRRGRPAVIGRVHEQKLWLDLRTLDDAAPLRAQLERVADQLAAGTAARGSAAAAARVNGT